MMKKIISYILAVLTALSCSLDRYYENGPSTGTYPSTPDEALSGLLACYKGLANSAVQYCPFPFRVVDQVSDIGTVRAGGSSYENLLTSVATPSSSVPKTAYSKIYRIAGRIHLVLDNLDNIESKMEPVEFNQIKAELLLLRAYIYDMGCQFFGDIPFIDHCLSLNDYEYARTPKSEVIDRILADIPDDLIDNLPVQWPYSQWGTCRIGRATAYALKAQINLNWGRFSEAARCSKVAMELSEGVYSLEPLDVTYYATAEDGEPSASNLFGFAGEKGSKEWMWAAQYNKLAAANIHAMTYTYSSRNANGASYFGPSQGLMDTFECTDGKSIVESPLYDWKNPWANRDPRLDLYCLRSDTRVMGVGFDLDATKTEVMDYNTGKMTNNNDVNGNKSEYGANGKKGPGGYLWRKYVDRRYYDNGEITGKNMEDDLDCCLMRYATLLLIDAEANIEMEGGDLDRARNDINLVRARVSMPKVSDNTQAGLRKALRYERKVELCAEGYRWFDIRRWGIAAKAVSGVMYAPGFSSKANPKNHISNAKPLIDDDWVVKYDGETTWDGSRFNLRTLLKMVYTNGRDEVWPIPETEMETNSKMVQNPGY